jgi:hypothetical protein
MPVVDNGMPDFPVVVLDFATINMRNAKCFQWNILQKEHLKDIMIANGEQIDRAAEPVVRFSKQARIDMSMGAHQRQAFNLSVKIVRDLVHRWAGISLTFSGFIRDASIVRQFYGAPYGSLYMNTVGYNPG